MLTVKVKRLTNTATLPTKMSEGAAGYDLYSDEDVRIGQGETKIVKTGISVEIPQGYEGQVRLRSSLGAGGTLLANGVGTIDSDYRGDVGVILHHTKELGRFVKKGDRIAQLVITPLTPVSFLEVEELSATNRGAGGYGSTGE